MCTSKRATSTTIGEKSTRKTVMYSPPQQFKEVLPRTPKHAPTHTAQTGVFTCTYSIIASVVLVTAYKWMHVPCVAGECYHVKAESSHANKGLPQSFSIAKLNKAATGKQNHARFDFFDEIKAAWDAW